MRIPEITRQLDEIKALYKLEPTMCDLYVEGINDVCLIRWFLAKKGILHVHVYPIDVIDIPKGAFDRLNLRADSNRNKVIVLAEELNRDLGDAKIPVRCIVDTDFDRYLGRLRKNYILEYTDYTSFEMYLFNPPTVAKFFHVALKNASLSPSHLLQSLKPILQAMFFIRLANESLNWGMKWIDIKKYISWTGKSLRFDRSKFVESYLMKNSRLKEIAEFKDAMEHFTKEIDPEPRNSMRGHDLTKLLFIVARRYGKHRGRFGNIETFEGSLYCCLEVDSLATEGLFVKLMKL